MSITASNQQMMQVDEQVADAVKSHNENQHIMRLRNQIEFYMGDANLSKDHFLQKKLEQSTLIELTIFKDFNRIKAIFAAAHVQDQAQ
jgi:La domain